MSEVVPLSPLRLPIPPYPRKINYEGNFYSTKNKKKTRVVFCLPL